ncbi:PAS domain-containing protein [Adhaeribacter aquaticus]|uniref:PAS domain-containing protein n=1 Tax=Adhaeribacter aquaticus TaxID=299567 RepID=UPI000416365F|nr:PAS domain-containing protein [Adhaeribacter aquaticus]
MVNPAAKILDLQFLLNSFPGQFLVLDTDLTIQHVSEAYLEATLTKRSAIIGQYLFDVFPDNPDVLETNSVNNLKRSLLQVIQTKRPQAMPVQRYDIPKPAELGGGFEERYWEPVNTPILDVSGELIALIHQVKDVTEKEKKKEVALRNEELIKAMTQTINDVVWDWNLITNDIWWSDGFNTGFGYAPQETEPTIESWYSRIHPEDAQRVVASIHQVIESAGQSLWSDIYRFKKKDGTYAEILDRGTVFRDENGLGYRMIGAMVDITINKKAELEAKDNAIRLSQVLESMPHMSWMANTAGQVTYYNQQWSNFLGVTLEDLYKLEWAHFMYPDDRKRTITIWENALKTGVPFEIENRYLKAPEMEYKWFLTRGVPIRNSEGEIDIWTGTCTFIDDQKKLTQKLQEQDEKIQLILGQAPAHFCLIKGEEQIIDFATPGIQKLFGNRECVGLPLSKAWPEIEEQGLTSYMRQVYETGKPLFFWETLVMVDRQNNGNLTEGYYDFTYQPFRNIQDAIEGVLILAIEVTDKVLAKQEAQKLSEELIQEKERFQFLAETIPQLIWTTDSNGFHDYFNQRWIDFTGYTVEASQGTEMWNNLLHPDDRERAHQRWQHSLQTGAFYEIEYRFKSKEGTYKWFLGQAVPMRNAQGEITKWFGTCTDIEEQKRWQEELISANDELKKANADLDSFVYTASHDLKLPIISMSRIFSELISSAHFTDPDADKLITMFQQSLIQINTTIQDLSDIVKVQKATDHVQKYLSLQTITEEVKLSINDIIQEAGAQITTDFNAAPEVYFSHVTLKSIIYNLLSNAIKYRSPERTPIITITSALKDQYTLVTVTDNGLGINLARHKEKLFKMFKRFHNHVPGSGIGLYIVNRLVEKQGGYIEVESEVNKGTTFKIYFRTEEKN